MTHSRTKAKLETANFESQSTSIGARPALWVSAQSWSEVDIPARPWIAHGYFLRGSITVVSGAGSAGKSSLVVAWTACLALGLPFHRMKAAKPLRVMSLNVEDDRDELQRRYSAILRRLGRSSAHLMENLVMIGPTGSGALLTLDRSSGALVNTPAMDQLETAITESKPDILFLDPMVELHDRDENDNSAVRGVLARFRSMAVAHDMAVVLLHHSRKGAAEAGDPDSMRGASAIAGAARVVLTLNVMTKEEADSFGIPQDRRRYYARLDGAKMNYAPVGDAEWFERWSYVLDNGPEQREDGDGVGVLTEWEPPSQIVSGDTLDKLEAVIAMGTLDGPFSPQPSKTPRSITTAMRMVGIDSKAAQKKALDDLLQAGRVTVVGFRRPGKGDERKGLRTARGLPSTVSWLSE